MSSNVKSKSPQQANRQAPRSRRSREKTKPSCRTRSGARLTTPPVKGSSPIMELPSAAGPSQVVKRLSQIHAQMLGLFAYEGVSRTVVNTESLRAGCGLNQDEFTQVLSGVLPEFVEAMKPRDALEKLALEQLMVHHARVLALSRQAAMNAEGDGVKVINEACDGASGSFRRLMTAFRDHRRPKDSGTSYTIGQANVAQQQVIQTVQNPELSRGKYDDQTRIGKQQEQAKLPAQPTRAAIPASFDPAPATMASKYRPQDSRGKSARQPQRAEARRAFGCKNRAPKAGARDN